MTNTDLQARALALLPELKDDLEWFKTNKSPSMVKRFEIVIEVFESLPLIRNEAIEGAEVIMFPLTKEISGPITMDAEAFKANLAAAYSAGAMMMRERAERAASKIAGNDKDFNADYRRGAGSAAAAIRALSQSPSGKDT